MKHKKELLEKVKKLRSQGKTYTEIKKILGAQIPKSTLSYWCKNTILPQWYRNKIEKLNYENRQKGRIAAWAVNKKKMENLLNQIHETNLYLLEKFKDKDVKKMLLAMLNLGEGAKWKSHRGLTLGNSDPLIIKLYLFLLHECYGITPINLKCRISYRADQNINNLQKFWSKITKIPLKNFYKTIPDPRTIGKPTKNQEYKGVCVVNGGSTKIQLELETISKILHGDVAQLV